MFADMGAAIAEATGTVKAFYGALGDIPTGWHLCNGEDGTPDLRNKFIIGAGDIYNVDDSGGSTEHNHTGGFASHEHALYYSKNAAAGGDVYASPNTATQSASGGITVNNKTTLPPYVGLFYIMKL